jgi:hypothetical protein
MTMIIKHVNEVGRIPRSGKIRQENQMTACPYPETITDQASKMEVSNPKYTGWIEGYEAHKLETNLSPKQLDVKSKELEAKNKQCDEFARNLSALIDDVRQLKTELEARNATLAKRL